MSGERKVAALQLLEPEENCSGPSKDNEQVTLTIEQLNEIHGMILLGKIAANSLHDINNNNTAQMGTIELMRMGVGDSGLQESLEILELSAASTREICSNVMALISGKERKTMGSHLIVDEVLNMAVRMLKNIVDITTDNLVEPVPLACGIQNQLLRVIVNLMLNAVDAGATNVSITVDTYDDEREGEKFIRICLSDNGKGMPGDVQKRIFEPLITFSGRNGSCGLGLSICRDIIVHEFGGCISVESELGEGTTFILDIPVFEVNASGVYPG